MDGIIVLLPLAMSIIIGLLVKCKRFRKKTEWKEVVVMSNDNQQNEHSGFTESERQFLTLNPIEWTRNNYPIFVRMYDGPLPRPRELHDIPYEIL